MAAVLATWVAFSLLREGMIRLPDDVAKDLHTTLFIRKKDQSVVTRNDPSVVVPLATNEEPPISTTPTDPEDRDGPLGNSLRDWLLS